MKKFFLCLIVILMSILSLSAQQWRLGAKVGANWSRIAKMPNGDAKQKMGWNIGVVTSYALNDYVAFQGELLYSQRGSNDLMVVGPLDMAGFDLTSHFVDLPLMIQFYPFRSENNFSLYAGLQPSFLLKESLDYEPAESTLSYGARKDFEFSLLFGCGYAFANGLFLEGRYVLGMTNLYEDYPDMMRGRSIQMAIGYCFRL